MTWWEWALVGYGVALVATLVGFWLWVRALLRRELDPWVPDRRYVLRDHPAGSDVVDQAERHLRLVQRPPFDQDHPEGSR